MSRAALLVAALLADPAARAMDAAAAPQIEVPLPSHGAPPTATTLYCTPVTVGILSARDEGKRSDGAPSPAVARGEVRKAVPARLKLVIGKDAVDASYVVEGEGAAPTLRFSILSDEPGSFIAIEDHAKAAGKVWTIALNRIKGSLVLAEAFAPTEFNHPIARTEFHVCSPAP